MIAQIDEQHAAMIANAMAPAGKANRFIRMGVAEVATSVGTVTMNHFGACSSTGKGAKPDG
jgi:hypothetical protein